MDYEGYKVKKIKIRAEIAALEQKEKELHSLYLEEHALPLGAAIIPNTGRLKGEKCHIVDRKIDTYYKVGEIIYEIRKAKKDGGASQNGKSDWRMRQSDFDVLEGDDAS